MPCDTRLLTFNEMLRCATQRQHASDERLEECRKQIERTKTSLQAAQEALDRAVFDEGETPQAYIDFSAPMREKLTSLYNTRTQAVLDRLSARETFSNLQKALDEATADFTVAQDARRKIAEERDLITSEIVKLSSPSR